MSAAGGALTSRRSSSGSEATRSTGCRWTSSTFAGYACSPRSQGLTLLLDVLVIQPGPACPLRPSDEAACSSSKSRRWPRSRRRTTGRWPPSTSRSGSSWRTSFRGWGRPAWPSAWPCGAASCRTRTRPPPSSGGNRSPRSDPTIAEENSFGLLSCGLAEGMWQVSFSIVRHSCCSGACKRPGVRRHARSTLQALFRGVSAGADSAAGWKALAELQYQSRQWKDAYETACRALEWSARRRMAGHETLTGCALSLRLCSARCLRRLDRLDEAEHAFKILAGAPPTPTWNHGSQRSVEHCRSTVGMSRHAFSRPQVSPSRVSTQLPLRSGLGTRRLDDRRRERL